MRRTRKFTLLATFAIAPVLGPAGHAQAARPIVSPADVKRTFVATGSYQSCAYGYLCAFVPYGSGQYRFDFTHCKRYRLANWYGYGSVLNAQYGGVRFTFYGANLNVLFQSTGRGEFRSLNWKPVYYIQPC